MVEQSSLPGMFSRLKRNGAQCDHTSMKSETMCLLEHHYVLWPVRFHTILLEHASIWQRIYLSTIQIFYCFLKNRICCAFRYKHYNPNTCSSELIAWHTLWHFLWTALYTLKNYPHRVLFDIKRHSVLSRWILCAPYICGMCGSWRGKESLRSSCIFWHSCLLRRHLRFIFVHLLCCCVGQLIEVPVTYGIACYISSAFSSVILDVAVFRVVCDKLYSLFCV